MAGAASGEIHAARCTHLGARVMSLTAARAAPPLGTIGTPIAVGIAQQLSLPTEPFVLAVLFGANMSFATPMAYQTNLLVMNAGNYTFSEFLKVGIPLTLLMWVNLTWTLSALYF